jgi:hypothetical protein
MSVMPQPGTYRINLPGMPEKILTITAAGASTARPFPLTRTEWVWEEHQNEPYLDGFGRLAFFPPDRVILILMNADGVEVYAHEGTYEPI